ncbi:MAG TPA: hypothetical protein P5533_06750 [Candidatus Cloacimonadota bacterium]|nr:hypothetical protein [Candidatus Cloacimonadota bacterium]
MKRVLKTIFLAGGVATAGYFGFKVYRIVQIMKLAEKTLPAHLESLCGELPHIDSGVAINTKTVLTFKIKLSPEAMAKLENLNESVLDHLRENYPGLMKYKIEIKAIELNPEDSFVSGAEHNDPEEG